MHPVQPVPEPIHGAPPYIVWMLGLIFIVLAIVLIYAVIAIAIGIYQEAQTRKTNAVAWFVAALLGGWLTAIIWLVVRDRYEDLALEMIINKKSPPKSD